MAVERALVDADPLVALLNAKDAAHSECTAAISGLAKPLISSWAVLAEAAWLLRNTHDGIQGLMRLVAEGVVECPHLDAAAARRRTVEAGDDARRLLERELHAGVQQHMLALTLKLRHARKHAVAGSELARLLDDALAEAGVANGALRELARGVYPIALTERGLAPALQALAARAAVPVHLRELPRRRFPALVEATAYFVVADTLAVARPDDAEVAVAVSDRGDRLLVELRGGGRLSADAVADRVTAVGGHLYVGGLADGGAVVRAEIPT